MSELDEFDEDDSTGTVFWDLIQLALIGFVAIVIMLLPHIKSTQKDDQGHRAPDNMIVEKHWPKDMSYVADLWVKSPDNYPGGFWNLGSDGFDLLRDDLGREGGATKDNCEITYSRGILKSEYIIKVQIYGPKPKNVLVPVNIVVSMYKPDRRRANPEDYHRPETAQSRENSVSLQDG